MSVIALRYYLLRENKRRSALLAAQDADAALGKVIEHDEDDNVIEKVVDRGQLDLVSRAVVRGVPAGVGAG